MRYVANAVGVLGAVLAIAACSGAPPGGEGGETESGSTALGTTGGAAVLAPACWIEPADCYALLANAPGADGAVQIGWAVATPLRCASFTSGSWDYQATDGTAYLAQSRPAGISDREWVADVHALQMPEVTDDMVLGRVHFCMYAAVNHRTGDFTNPPQASASPLCAVGNRVYTSCEVIKMQPGHDHCTDCAPK